MRGFPINLNTKADYDFVHAEVLAGRLPALRLIEAYQALLNTQKHYVFDRILADNETPDGPEPDYHVMEEEKEDATRRVQYKLVDNSNARIHQLGFTVEDIQARIQEVESYA